MRTKTVSVAAALLLAVVLAACGGGEVAVRVADTGPEGELQPQEDVPVMFLPYDRDSIFEALERQADSPRPEIPDTLRALYSEIIDRQERWRSLERRWQQWRDSLKTISERMEGLNEASDRYKRLYDAFTSLEPRVQALDRKKTGAFESFESLQTRVLNFADSIQALRKSWAETAYEGYVQITDSIEEARGREAIGDTTNADGWVNVTLPDGQWWVYARIQRPFEEVYWNVPIVPARTDTLVLTPDTAEVRLAL